jgi:hypothetical protein
MHLIGHTPALATPIGQKNLSLARKPEVPQAIGLATQSASIGATILILPRNV